VLFATVGIEQEIVADAQSLRVLSRLDLPAASIGQLGN
jgi:hypothetical protein